MFVSVTMGNDSSVTKKISNKINKKESYEQEFSIGSPTNVVHLDQSEVLKLIQNHNDTKKQENDEQIQRKQSETRQRITRECSKMKENFQSFIEEELLPKKSSSASLEKTEDEEMTIGNPTNVEHITGLDVVKLVEKQVQSCSTKMDNKFNQRLENAKELPKMLFQPEAFQEGLHKSTTKSLVSESESLFNDRPQSLSVSCESRQSVSFASVPESHLSKTSIPSCLLQDFHDGLKSVKESGRLEQKGKIEELIQTMHEALDVIATIAKKNVDYEDDEV